MKILKGNFARSVLLIAGGTAFAQILSTLLSPIITRIYPPEQYGVLTIYNSILSMLAIIGSLKYELAIPIADDEEKSINVLSASIIILFVVTTLITLLLIFFGDEFIGLFGGELLSKYKYFISIGIFLMGTYNIFTQWAYRKKSYRSISKTKLSQSITQNITKIVLGLLNFGPVGLIAGNILGQSSGITTLSRSFIKEDKHLLKKINKKAILWSLKRYKRFPIFSAPSQFFNTAGIQIPVLFITILYGNEVIGLYGLANSIVNLPMNLIGRSIGDVFYGEAASIGRTDPKRLKDLSSKLLKKLILIGLIPLITLILFGPLLFSIVFGQNWYEAGVYARIIAFLVFARLIFTPISRVYSVFERQKEEFFLDLFRVLLVLIVFGISKVFSLSSYGAVLLYSIAMSIVYFITYLVGQKIINEEISKLNY